MSLAELKKQIKQKAQLPRTGFSRELHREGHFVITMDSNGKIELTRYHPTQETHILVNPWFSDVSALLSECEEKLRKLFNERPLLLVTEIVNEPISEELWNKLWRISHDWDEWSLKLEKELEQ